MRYRTFTNVNMDRFVGGAILLLLLSLFWIGVWNLLLGIFEGIKFLLARTEKPKIQEEECEDLVAIIDGHRIVRYPKEKRAPWL